ncbi:MAG: FHA domain-containing protein [Planctomycetota bacterium]|nr:FHA domain-containing protein [Planctomycetota bacterium]
MPAEFVSLDEGSSIVLDRPIILVGRHEECDIILDSRKISRKHCCIALQSDHCIIRDLGSTNGLLVNNQRVMEARVFSGDEVSFGGLRYQLRITTQDSILSNKRDLTLQPEDHRNGRGNPVIPLGFGSR